jgi:DNA-binding Xre family transcriptional regulator
VRRERVSRIRNNFISEIGIRMLRAICRILETRPGLYQGIGFSRAVED